MNYVKELVSKGSSKKPFLFSYRRCPYAMRARMAMISAPIEFDIYEISLKEKPKEMLAISPKGTVPVLVYEESVIDESLDIMNWAYSISDKANHYVSLTKDEKRNSSDLILTNDNDFKSHLDRYKYSSNNKALTPDMLYKKCLFFMYTLEDNLLNNSFLITNKMSFADIAIFPFVRQFANVNLESFMKGDFKKTIDWYLRMQKEKIFSRAMEKPNIIF